MKIVCVMPIYERSEIAVETLKLFKQQSLPLYEIIAVGSTPNDRITAEKAGVTFLEYANKPLSNKVQYGIDAAREREPDAILTTGSDSWPTNSFCEILAGHLEQGADLVGKTRSYSCKVNPKQSLEVLEHTYKRRKDPIGGGRLLSKKALDLIDWQVYASGLNKGLDGASYRVLIKNIKNLKVLIANSDINAFSMDVKSTLWRTITTFQKIKSARGDLHIKNIVSPEKWLNEHYPGSLVLLKNMVPGVQIKALN